MNVETSDSNQLSFVVDRLAGEFGSRVDPDTLRAVAVREMASFEGARVRDFVPILAWRQARMQLRQTLN
jgi:hypothetical protein